MYSANIISLYIMGLSKLIHGETMDNMKLNKLLYLCQGHYLAVKGEKLFKEDLEAFKRGPVVREIYTKYKHFGKENIIIDDICDIDMLEIEEEDKNVIIEVLSTYMSASGLTLSRKSHQPGSPWENAHNIYQNATISTVDMQNYFNTGINRIKTAGECLEEFIPNFA